MNDGVDPAGGEAGRSVRAFETYDVLFRQGEPAPGMIVVSDGWLVLETALEDGRRAIPDVAPPGSTLSVQSGPDGSALCSAVAVTKGVASLISRPHMEAMRNACQVFDRRVIQEAERSRLRLADRLLSVTARGAREALARLLLEIVVRTTGAHPPATGSRSPLPLTQSQLGAVLGHTNVYVNRLLRELREDRIVEFHRGQLIVLDAPAFLHLAGETDIVLPCWEVSVEMSAMSGGAAAGEGASIASVTREDNPCSY